jgi:hypothetical protein
MAKVFGEFYELTALTPTWQIISTIFFFSRPLVYVSTCGGDGGGVRDCFGTE